MLTLGFILLIIIFVIIVALFNKEKLKEIYVDNIKYDMKITDNQIQGTAVSIDNYVLVNKTNKVAYCITSASYFVKGHQPNINTTINKIKLTDEGIKKLISYANLNSNVDASSSAFLQLSGDSYYSIVYNKKIVEISVKGTTIDIDKLFDKNTKEY